MTQRHSDNSGLQGNTKVEARDINNEKKIKRARNWIWTWNNYEEDDKINMKNWCEEECEDYVFQEETGENGTKHLQGFWCFKNARHFESLKKKWGKMHIEKAKNAQAARNYCGKDETRSGEKIESIKQKVKDPLEGIELRQWQKDLLKLLEEEPDNRTVIWIYDEIGNAGKTTLAKHLCLKYENEVIYLTGGPANCKYGVTSFLYNKCNGQLVRNKKKLKIAIFDYTRSQDDKVSYQALEEIKNGIFFNTKYESMQVVYDCPHVVIFANFLPELNKLSKDRWKIIDINENI